MEHQRQHLLSVGIIEDLNVHWRRNTEKMYGMVVMPCDQYQQHSKPLLCAYENEGYFLTLQ